MTIILLACDNQALLLNKIGALVQSLVNEDPDVDVIRTITIQEMSQALDTPSLLSDTRVIVLLEALSAAQQGPLVDVVASADVSLEGLTLVLAIPKPSAALKKAVMSAGGDIIEVLGKTYRDTAADLLSGSALTVRAKALVAETVGEQVEQIPPLLDLLRANFVDGQQIDVSDLVPFLADKGSVPVWELTDAIDQADPAKALGLIDRLLWLNNAYALLSIITSHIERLFRLSQMEFKDEAQAAAYLGMKGSTYPAKKALMTVKRYGVSLPSLALLTAKAGNDMRGAVGLPQRVVLEVLVGRLCTFPRR